MKQGSAYIVGAGPGAVDLLTLRAYRLLCSADVILFDRLVNPQILDLARRDALMIDVGKRLRQSSAARQNTIHLLLAEHVRAGKKVVRLKGGDPFVFGRGGEEVLALAEEGIHVEVVPGISSSVAVPASAGIPVTMRGMASSFGVFTGHPAEDSDHDGIDWDAAARVGTAVFLMGVGRLSHLVSQLLAHERSPQTPIAIVANGTLPNEQVVVGTLQTIVSKAGNISPPATIIVGEVVHLRERIRAILSRTFQAESQNAMLPPSIESITARIPGLQPQTA